MVFIGQRRTGIKAGGLQGPERQSLEARPSSPAREDNCQLILATMDSWPVEVVCLITHFCRRLSRDLTTIHQSRVRLTTHRCSWSDMWLNDRLRMIDWLSIQRIKALWQTTSHQATLGTAVEHEEHPAPDPEHQSTTSGIRTPAMCRCFSTPRQRRRPPFAAPAGRALATCPPFGVAHKRQAGVYCR